MGRQIMKFKYKGKIYNPKNPEKKLKQLKITWDEVEIINDLQEEDEDLFDKWVILQSEYPEVIRLARAFEGIPRNYGVHAGGVLITPTAINDTFPTRTIDGRKVTVWDKNVVEEAGGVKYDFLGLTTISVIELCLSYINKNYDINLTIKDLYATLTLPDNYSFKTFFSNTVLIDYLMVNCGIIYVEGIGWERR